MPEFKSGFVSIIGLPNAGKSTLLNALLGQKLSIVTHKVQTTRHRIMGILQDEKVQIVFFDTPGLLEPKYELHTRMMNQVEMAIKDADVMLLIIDLKSAVAENEFIASRIHKGKIPLIIFLNKTDAVTPEKKEEAKNFWQQNLDPTVLLIGSALTKGGLNELLEAIRHHLPVNPPYYEGEEVTDRTERFLVGEIIREKIFLNYHEEIPYSAEVEVFEFKEKETLTVIRANIYVEREMQKRILIGHKGEAIKNLGIDSRTEIETFIDRKVFLELHVKVAGDWRKNASRLKGFGY